MPRSTTFLALVQTLLIIVGFFALAAVLKISGYPHEAAVRWNPLAVLLREHGMWLLLLPVLWVIFATIAERLDRGAFSDHVALALGIGLALVTIALFLCAAVFPFSRPLVLG
jgi:uncharacterized membrane protein